MKYSKIITYDACNSHGYSVTLWVCGCDNKCEGCFNKELWDYNCGKAFNEETYNTIKENLSRPHIKNFVLLGGEPLSIRNRADSIKLLNRIKKDFPSIKNIVYTGFTVEELKLKEEELSGIDYIIDGRFNNKMLTPAPQLRGSLNQKCYEITGEKELLDITDKYFE